MSRRSSGSVASSSRSASTTWARRSSRSSGDGGASRPTGSSRCARTTCSARSSPRRASRARTRRAASRARSGASAAITSSPSRRSRTWRTQRAAAGGLRGGLAPADRRAWRDGRRGMGSGAPAAARAAPRGVRRDRDRGAARGREVVGHDPPEPLLGPGRARRVEGQCTDRREGDRDQPRRRGGRASRAAARPLRHQRAARPLPRTARTQAGRPGALAGARAAARARRLAGSVRRAVDGTDRPLWPLGGRPPDGRRPAALPRARARPCRAGGPRRARRLRDRRPRRPGPGPPRRARADRPGAAERPRAAARRARAPSARPRRLRPAARRTPMTPTNAKTAALETLIEAHAIELKLPTVRRRFRQLAAEATREQQTPVAYLAALLEAEIAERAERRERRRLIDARFPQIKRLEDFRFADNPNIPQTTLAALAEGSWIDDRESIILLGESGTGKTHLATALAVCACQAGRRVRFTTLAALANELQEAEGRRELARVVARYARPN